MKLLFSMCALTALVSAEPNFDDWHPQSEGQVRSPCPALNSLANHGILPRDGYNLTVPIMVQALGDGLMVSPEVATTLTLASIRLSKNPAGSTFNLDDLNRHNGIEHDASLSRKDIELGGNEKLDPETFEKTLSHFNGASEIGFDEVAAARWARVEESKASNPKFTYGDSQLFSGYFESSAYYQALKDPKTGKVRVDWFKVLFQEERLPTKEGWKPVNRIDGLTIAQAVLQIALRTPEKMGAAAASRLAYSARFR